jgi:Spy/CpxP family protein refolding chaperone
MENTNKYKWRVRLVAVAIFLLGILTGALALNLYHARYGGPEGRGRGQEIFRFRNLDERLSLTPDQATEVEKIFDDARDQLRELRRQSAPKFDEIRGQVDERLQKVLTPEQWGRFQQMRDEMRGRHRGRRRG